MSDLAAAAVQAVIITGSTTGGDLAGVWRWRRRWYHNRIGDL